MTTTEWSMLPCWLIAVGAFILIIHFIIDDLKSPKKYSRIPPKPFPPSSGMPRPYPPSEKMIQKRKLIEEEKQELLVDQIATKVAEKLNGR